ncbi:MAG: thermonuclease family protein [Candidatus Omnitrophica bacterium]|nr:thermonuclease family protein [Candidatus Omnitrophota bacterium]
MIVILFLSIFFLSCSSVDNYSQIKVKEVIDGDTVILANGKILRYIGIDTPEVRIKQDKGFTYDPQPFALEAKEANRKLVENKFVRIEFDVEKNDEHKRLLGYCFVDDLFVNAKLVEDGLAVLYTRPPNVKYADLFVELQKKARLSKKGIWGTYEVISSDEAHKFINSIRRVRGRVIDTYQSSKAVFLNFGKDYRKDFTVVIFNDCLKFFREKNIEPAIFYRGKTIEVSGRIKEYNGPEIIVCTPYQIELVKE